MAPIRTKISIRTNTTKISTCYHVIFTTQAILAQTYGNFNWNKKFRSQFKASAFVLKVRWHCKTYANKEISLEHVSVKSKPFSVVFITKKTPRVQRLHLNSLNNLCTVLLVVNIHWLTFRRPGWPRVIFLEIIFQNNLDKGLYLYISDQKLRMQLRIHGRADLPYKNLHQEAVAIILSRDFERGKTKSNISSNC